MICSCPSCGGSINLKKSACRCGQRVRVRRNGDVGYQVTYVQRNLRPSKEFKDGDLRNA